MSFVQAKCPNCGGILAVDNSNDAALCPFCNSPYVVEKAINNYNITNNITAGTVNVTGNISNDFVIRAGVLEKYTGTSIEVTIPDNIYAIGEKAFFGCKLLRTVNLHNSVKEIGDYAFAGCLELLEINLFSGIRKIGVGAFESCESLRTIKLPPFLGTIQAYTFSKCKNLANIVIPDSINSIGHDAFYACESLESITIGPLVSKIGSRAFFNCINLKKVILNANIQSNYKKGSSQYEYGYDNGDCVFFNAGRNGEGIELIIGDSVTTIPGSLFGECWYDGELKTAKIKSLHLGSSVKEIGPHAFISCGLKNIDFPSSLESIGEWAFRNNAFTSLVIPSTVKHIGDYAFANNVSLTVVKTNLDLSQFHCGSIFCMDPVLETIYRSFCKCSYCGGQFGMFNKCKNCGRKKNY